MLTYRELLALYFANQGNPGEALAILKEASGGPHPLIPFLADLEAMPNPGGAEFLMNHGAGLAALYQLGESGDASTSAGGKGCSEQRSIWRDSPNHQRMGL